MEIYKLTDEVPEGKRKSGDVVPEGKQKSRDAKKIVGGGGRFGDSGTTENNGELVITDMKSGVKNPERVNVYVNSSFAFSLDVAQVVDHKLKIGTVLSPERLMELKNASEFGKLYQRTLEWVLMRPRSVRETREYIVRKLKMSSSGRSSRPSSRGSSLRPRSDCGCPSEDNFQFPNESFTSERSSSSSSRGSSLRPRSDCGCPSEDNFQFPNESFAPKRSSNLSSRGSSLRSRSDCGCPSEDNFQSSNEPSDSVLSSRPSSQNGFEFREEIAKVSEEIISRLINKHYLDDKKFAEFWVENRFVKKGVSRKRLRMELMKKGVAADVIDEVLNGRSEREEILKMIARKRKKYDNEKLLAYLCRQGFSYDLAREMVEESSAVDGLDVDSA